MPTGAALYLVDAFERARPALRLLGGSIAHFFGAALIAILAEGILANLVKGTKVESFFIVELLSGLLAGLFLSANLLGGRGALCAWLVGVINLSSNIHELANSWSPAWSRQVRWAYVADNMFSPSRCSDTECLYMAFGTMPFITSCVL